MPTKDRVIVHVDMDAFFASIEERDNPAYRGKPIIVGADPKGGRGRGVVSTCSYAARKFGIHSAMPISTAYRRCSGAVFLPVDYEKYSRVSAQILYILEGFTPDIEQVSIDEAFLDMSDTYQRHGSPYEACSTIKRRIKEETGLSASVGVAPTKMAAKIASGLCKPDGLLEVTEDKLLDFLRVLDVDLLWGVGKKTKDTLNEMGIYTIGDLEKRSKEELTGVFGKSGVWLWEASRGIDEGEVTPEHDIKSISNETTFLKDTNDAGKIERELARLSEMVSDRLRDGGFKCRTLTLKIRLEGFRTYTRAVTVAEPTNFSEDLIKTVRNLFRKFELKGNKVRLVGVRSSNLSGAHEEPLFKTKADERKEEIHRAVDRIRKKFGKDCILRAASVEKDTSSG